MRNLIQRKKKKPLRKKHDAKSRNNKAIDESNSNADVTAAKEAGSRTITPVRTQSKIKPAIKQAIEDAYTQVTKLSETS